MIWVRLLQGGQEIALFLSIFSLKDEKGNNFKGFSGFYTILDLSEIDIVGRCFFISRNDETVCMYPYRFLGFCHSLAHCQWGSSIGSSEGRAR